MEAHMKNGDFDIRRLKLNEHCHSARRRRDTRAHPYELLAQTEALELRLPANALLPANLRFCPRRAQQFQGTIIVPVQAQPI